MGPQPDPLVLWMLHDARWAQNGMDLAIAADQSDEQVAERAEQAVTRAIRAVLAVRGVKFRTDALDEMIRLLDDNSITHPAALFEAGAFDRDAVRDRVRDVIAWATAEVIGN